MLVKVPFRAPLQNLGDAAAHALRTGSEIARGGPCACPFADRQPFDISFVSES
jgi:hypothetical protein